MMLFYPILAFGIVILILLIIFFIKSIKVNREIRKAPYFTEYKKANK